MSDITRIQFDEHLFSTIEEGKLPLRAPEKDGSILIGVHRQSFAAAVVSLHVMSGFVRIERDDEQPLQVGVHSYIFDEFVKVFDEPIDSLTLQQTDDGRWAAVDDGPSVHHEDAYAMFVETLSIYAGQTQASRLL